MARKGKSTATRAPRSPRVGSRSRGTPTKSREEPSTSRGSKRVRFAEQTESENSQRSSKWWAKGKKPKWLSNKEMVPEEEWATPRYFGFRDGIRKRFYEFHYDKRRLSEYRAIDFEFLNQYKFPIQRWMREQGWLLLLQEKNPVYKFLVQIFYCNYNEHGALVKNKSIIFGSNPEETATTLANILQIPNDNDPIPENISQADIFNFLTQSNTANRSTSSVKYQSLPDEFKVLRHILSYILLPKMGSRDVVTVVESRIMYKIIKGLKVSLPMLMVEHMEQASGSRVNLTLPYAPWLTKVFKYCEVSLDGEEEEEPEGIIGKDLLRRMHVDLERAQARFQVEWERRSKHRNGGGAPGGVDLGGEAHASDSEATSTDGDVDAFVRVDRVAPPQGEERAPETRVPSPPRSDHWSVPPPSQPPSSAWPPSAPFPHPEVMTDPGTSASSSSSDVAIILREIRNLSYGFRLLTHRFDTFENQCINRFDYFEHELGALRLQARFPSSPIPSHASFRPERARAASSGSNEPVHISSSSSDHPEIPPPPPAAPDAVPPLDHPLLHKFDKKGEKPKRKRKFLSLEEPQLSPAKRRRST